MNKVGIIIQSSISVICYHFSSFNFISLVIPKKRKDNVINFFQGFYSAFSPADVRKFYKKNRPLREEKEGNNKVP